MDRARGRNEARIKGLVDTTGKRGEERERERERERDGGRDGKVLPSAVDWTGA